MTGNRLLPGILRSQQKVLFRNIQGETYHSVFNCPPLWEGKSYNFPDICQWTFYFCCSLKCSQRAKHQAEGSSVYLCNRSEHIHILFAHRTNISLGMKLRQQSRIRHDRPPKTAPPSPQGRASLGTQDWFSPSPHLSPILTD